jgi:hypothetical protein
MYYCDFCFGVFRRKIDNKDKSRNKNVLFSVPFSWVHTKLIAKALNGLKKEPSEDVGDKKEDCFIFLFAC